LNIEARLQEAVEKFWEGRKNQQQKQIDSGRIDAGTRGAVTGGTHMGALEVLVTDILIDAGLKKLDVRSRTGIELPGYYRPEKKWDLIVVSEGQLVTAIEFKSMVGSVGKNINNRAEEAIGNASDLWVAYREGRYGTAPTPFLGYFFLLQNDAEVQRVQRGFREPYFKVDPVFQGTSYGKRYEIMCRRFVLERIYSAACLVLSTENAEITQPADDLSFQRFAAALKGHVVTFLESQKSRS
jgi:Restriction endonuclease XhoI